MFIITIYLVSYSFILEARYILPEENETTVELTIDSTYAVLNEDGLYDIYYGDYIINTTQELNYYPSDMPVYDSLEEVPEELRVHY